MNDQHLTQLLSDISQERIPDDMDLWNAIQEQVEKPQNVRRIRRSRSGWLLAAIVAIMVTGVVAVLAQGGGDNNHHQDPGIQAAAEEGLVIYLNETQTQDNISVTIDYAYADANRVTIAYSTEVTLPSDNNLTLYTSARLETDAPLTTTPTFGGGGGGGGSNSDATVAVVTRRSQTTQNFNVIGDYAGDTLALRYTVDVRLIEQGLNSFDESIPPTASMTFDIEIPFYQGHRLTQPQQVETNGLSMTLQDVIVTTAMTRLVLCYDAPEATQTDVDSVFIDQPWQAQIELTVAGDTVENDLNWVFWADPTTPSEDGCVNYYVPESLSNYVDSAWTLTIPFLYQAGPFPVESVTAALEAQGVTVVDGNAEPHATPSSNTVTITTENGGISIAIHGVPVEGETAVDIQSIISGASIEAAEKIEGPWQFSFDLAK